jgi:hypothetical protein
LSGEHAEEYSAIGTLRRDRHLLGMISKRDPADYCFAVMRRGTLAKPWRWEIYRAGQTYPVERSPVLFESMAQAVREGKKALAEFLDKRAA